MFLSEPPRTQADIHFVLFGIPVRIHPLFWLVTLFLGPYDKEPVLSVLWVGAVLVAIVVHELGHALVMRAYGDWPSIVLHGFGGLAIPSSGRRPGRLGRILISAAGPGAGFLLAAGLFVVLLLVRHGVYVGLFRLFGLPILPVAMIEDYERLTQFLNYVFYICVMWGLVNLLPVYPLDGGHIAQEILLAANPQDGVRQSLILSIVTAAAMTLVAITQWHSLWTAVLFGYLGYTSFVTLQAYSSHRW